MTAERDPFANPFPKADKDRSAIWEMLVPRDIDAWTSADWDRVAGDFSQGPFIGLSGNHQPDPQGFTLAFPSLALYREEWLHQAQAHLADRAAGRFDGDPRPHIYAATRLEEIEITGDAALVRKKFNGWLPRADGSRDRMNWQTLYICRRESGDWKIAGFVGYLPHIRD
ncbi:hypothetical protein [Pseudogemmobacter bohemicus]|uniref:hypothetical protein n=1 Tax=Pseudogemmobacter bohemicus TaxID=2250708 RepID=UPI000DD2C278|nr:hypothetical protein [Pseudogemmobacter bohemicus]